MYAFKLNDNIYFLASVIAIPSGSKKNIKTWDICISNKTKGNGMNQSMTDSRILTVCSTVLTFLLMF